MIHDRRRALYVSLLALAACAPERLPTTGGTDVAPGPFGRGVFTVNQSDSYDSTNVSLVGLDGSVLSQSLLSAGLSGDVYAPTMASTGDDLVLVDRAYSILTWVTVRTGAVRAQLHADDDGLARNPWDYLPVAPDKAYVVRYDPWPGKGEHGDVVVVNPETASVSSGVGERIPVAPALGLGTEWVVHPARGVVIGDRAYVVTVNATTSYEYTVSHVVEIDTQTDAITAVREISGLHDCNAIAASPDGESLAVACAGDLQANGAVDQGRSGVVVLARDTLEEKARFSASEIGDGVVGFSLTYVSDARLLVLVVGSSLEDVPDTAVLVDIGSGETRVVHATAPVNMGGVLCPARVDGAGDSAPSVCFITDAEGAALRRYPIEDGDLGPPRAIDVDDVVGLPPRYIGQF